MHEFNKKIKGEWRYQFDADSLSYNVYNKNAHICTLIADDPDTDYPIKEDLAEAISLLPELIKFRKKTLSYLTNADDNKEPYLLLDIIEVDDRIKKALGLMEWVG